jgi:ParB family chromosome partitioning protein
LEDSSTDITTSNTPSGEQLVVGSISELPIGSIEPYPFQPRTSFDETAIAELAQSILQLGIIQPVTVRKLGKDRYQLISGERRFRASQKAGLDRIPAYVRVTNDQGMLEMALVENIQRQELDAIEVAISFKRLADEIGLKQEELGERVGKDRSTVNNYLRLLKLPPEIQLGIRQRRIGMGHAKALLSVSDPLKQLEMFEDIVSSKLSVRAVEALAKGKPERPAKNSQRNHTEMAKEMSSLLGTQVVIKSSTNGQGKVEIRFKDLQELDRIRDLLS